MYRRGIVEEVDAATHRVRVRFPQRQDVLSPWLDVIVRDVGDDKDFGLPSKGAQVACFLDENDEEGCVMGAVYSSADKPNAPQSEDARHWSFKDGTQVTYDRAAHKLTIELASGGLVEIGGDAQFLVRADKFLPEFMAHVHPTGVGPSGPPSAPLTVEQISTETLKAT